MVGEFHETDETNGGDPPEIARYLEYDPAFTRNFDEVDEFHNSYHEFAMDSEQVSKPAREAGYRPKNDSDAVSDADPSAAASSGSAASSATAAQVLTTTFVALVAVSAVVLPVLENTELSVSVDAYSSGDVLGFYIYLDNYSEDGEYWAYVTSGGTVYDSTRITDGFLEKSVTGLPPGMYSVEVRTGTPPLLVVGSTEVEVHGGGIYADKLFTTSTEIYGGLVLTGATEANPYMIFVYESGSDEPVFSAESWEEGYDLHVGGLTPNTSYRITVTDFEMQKTLMEEGVRTSESVDVSVSDLSATMTTLSFTLTIPEAYLENTFEYSLLDSNGDEVHVGTAQSSETSVSIDSLVPESEYILLVGNGAGTTYFSQEMTTAQYVAPTATLQDPAFGVTYVSADIYFEGEYIDATVRVTDPEGTEVYSEKVDGDYIHVEATGLVPSTEYTVTVVDDHASSELLTSAITTEANYATVSETHGATSAEITAALEYFDDSLSIVLYVIDSSSQTVYSQEFSESAMVANVSGLVPAREYTVRVADGGDNILGETVFWTDSLIGSLTLSDADVASFAYSAALNDFSETLGLQLQVADPNNVVVSTVDLESGDSQGTVTGLYPYTEYSAKVVYVDPDKMEITVASSAMVTADLTGTLTAASPTATTAGFTYDLSGYADSLGITVKAVTGEYEHWNGTPTSASGTMTATDLILGTTYTLSLYYTGFAGESVLDYVEINTADTISATLALGYPGLTSVGWTATTAEISANMGMYVGVYDSAGQVYASDALADLETAGTAASLAVGTSYTAYIYYTLSGQDVRISGTEQAFSTAGITGNVEFSLVTASSFGYTVTLDEYTDSTAIVIAFTDGRSEVAESVTMTSAQASGTITGLTPNTVYTVTVSYGSSVAAFSGNVTTSELSGTFSLSAVSPRAESYEFTLDEFVQSEGVTIDITAAGSDKPVYSYSVSSQSTSDTASGLAAGTTYTASAVRDSTSAVIGSAEFSTAAEIGATTTYSAGSTYIEYTVELTEFTGSEGVTVSVWEAGGNAALQTYEQTFASQAHTFSGLDASTAYTIKIIDGRDDYEVKSERVSTAAFSGTITTSSVTTTGFAYEVQLNGYSEALGLKFDIVQGQTTVSSGDFTSATLAGDVSDLIPSTTYTLTAYYPGDSGSVVVCTDTVTTADVVGTITLTAQGPYAFHYSIVLDEYPETVNLKARFTDPDGSDMIEEKTLTGDISGTVSSGLTPNTEYTVAVYFDRNSESVIVAYSLVVTDELSGTVTVSSVTATTMAFDATLGEYSDTVSVMSKACYTSGSDTQILWTGAVTSASASLTARNLIPDTEITVYLYYVDPLTKSEVTVTSGSGTTSSYEGVTASVTETTTTTASYTVTVPELSDNYAMYVTVEDNDGNLLYTSPDSIAGLQTSGSTGAVLMPYTNYTLKVLGNGSELTSVNFTTANLEATLSASNLAAMSFDITMTLSTWVDGITAYFAVYNGADAVYTSQNATAATLEETVSGMSSGTAYTVNAFYDPGSGAVQIGTGSVTTAVEISSFEVTSDYADTVSVDLSLVTYDISTGDVIVRLYEGQDTSGNLIASEVQTSSSQTHTFTDGVSPGTYTVSVYDANLGGDVSTQSVNVDSATATVSPSQTAVTASLEVVVSRYSDTSDFVTVSLYEGSDTTVTPVYSATQTSATQTHVVTDLVPETDYTYVVYDTLTSSTLATDVLTTSANAASLSADFASTKAQVTATVDYYAESLGLYLVVSSDGATSSTYEGAFESTSLTVAFDVSPGQTYTVTVYKGHSDETQGTVMFTDQYTSVTAYVGPSNISNAVAWNLSGNYGAVSLYIYTSSDGRNPDDVDPITYEVTTTSGNLDLTDLDGIVTGNYYVKAYSTTHSETLLADTGGDAACVVYVTLS